MKIIDLLNMIVEGKEVPKFKFKKRNSIWKYNPLYFQFQSKDSSLCLDIMPVLNEEVEIIEEDNNKIEKLNIDALENLESKAIGRRVNQIIDKINNME